MIVQIKLFDLDTFNCIQTLVNHANNIRAIDKLSINQLVSCSTKGLIKIWDLSNGKYFKAILDMEISSLRVILDDTIVGMQI